jgi:cathepsin D
MYLLSIFFVSTLLTFATALPLSAPLSIALNKRSTLTKNGIVDLNAVRSHVTHLETYASFGLESAIILSLAIRKYLRGIAAFKRNTGVPPSSLKDNVRRAAGSDTLTDDSNTRWYGTITVGTPAVDYNGGLPFTVIPYSCVHLSSVDFDTGSADLFLPASNCGSTCEGHTLYNPNASSSAVDLNKAFNLAYGDGSTVLGEQYNDTVGIAGFVVSPFCLVCPILSLTGW